MGAEQVKVDERPAVSPAVTASFGEAAVKYGEAYRDSESGRVVMTPSTGVLRVETVQVETPPTHPAMAGVQAVFDAKY
ncbi:MAG TPA: hypothetical protein VG604_01520 [Candidatus Saccharimonadales bacterium]|nr:hypothetical protein [Candidatus Saccharimonadales bacterium]